MELKELEELSQRNIMNIEGEFIRLPSRTELTDPSI